MINKTVIYILVILLMDSCNVKMDNTSRQDKLASILGAKINVPVTNINVEKISLDPSYKHPYNIYISFNLDTNNYSLFVRQLGLIEYAVNNGKDSSLCLSKPFEQYKVKPFWNFGPTYNKQSWLNFEKNLSWWEPNIIEPNNLFGAYYKESNEYGDAKIIKCNGTYDGRILAQLNGNTVYIFIECFTK